MVDISAVECQAHSSPQEDPAIAIGRIPADMGARPLVGRAPRLPLLSPRPMVEGGGGSASGGRGVQSVWLCVTAAARLSAQPHQRSYRAHDQGLGCMATHMQQGT